MSTQLRPVGTTAPIWAYRSLIWNFARRDLKSRYRGTALGWLWSLLLPLATLAVYTLVFSKVFRLEPPAFGSGRAGVYSVWLFVGLVTWQFLANGINAAVPSLLTAGRLLQKIYIPSYIPVFGSTIATAIQSSMELAIVVLVLVALLNVGLSWIVLPVVLGLYFVFVSSVALALSVLNVYMRDLRHIVAVVLQLLFFATPVLYPPTLLPEEAWGIPLRAVLSLNPIAVFINAVRDIMYNLQLPSLSSWGLMIFWCLVAVAVAMWVFRRKGRDIGETV